MILCVYSIRDRVAGEFGIPFYAPNDAAAIRSVRELLLQDSQYSKFPDDFVLARIAQFDTVAGSFVDVLSDPYYVVPFSSLLSASSGGES